MARQRTKVPPIEALPRLVRQPGRRYMDPVTEIVYTNRGVATARSGASPEAYARARKLAEAGVIPFEENVEHLYKSYRQRLKREGKTITKKGAYTKDSEFLRALKDLQTKGRTPGTKKARALETLGLREPNARYRVGESPAPSHVPMHPDL